MIIFGWILFGICVLGVLLAPLKYQQYINGRKPVTQHSAALTTMAGIIESAATAYFFWWAIH